MLSFLPENMSRVWNAKAYHKFSAKNTGIDIVHLIGLNKSSTYYFVKLTTLPDKHLLLA